MDGVYIGNFGGADNGGNIQITLRKLWRTYADGFIRKAHGKGIAVGFAVNSDRLNAQFLAGANHPQSNFTAIGYQDFLEHEKAALGSEHLAAMVGTVLRMTLNSPSAKC